MEQVRKSAALLRRSVSGLRRTLRAAGIPQALRAAEIRPLSVRVEARENTLRFRAEVRTGGLCLRLEGAWGQETFFRMETVEPPTTP